MDDLNQPVPPPVPDPKRKIKIGIIVGVIAALVIAAGATGFYFWRTSQNNKATTSSTIDASISSTSATSSAAATSTSTTSSPSGGDENTSRTVACTAQEYAMEESVCASQTPEPVCGNIRYVYDNGAEQFQNNNFTNVCEYCSQFDTNGFLELRGTKMYSMGYSMGRCQ